MTKYDVAIAKKLTQDAAIRQLLKPVARRRRFARTVDKMITHVQEWLERRDRDIDSLVANLIIGAVAVYVAAAVVEMVWR